jgi:hypothetical protein
MLGLGLDPAALQMVLGVQNGWLDRLERKTTEMTTRVQDVRDSAACSTCYERTA